MERILRKKSTILFFIAPATILFCVILLVPICYSVYISFCDWDVLTQPELTGFSNYIRLFTRDEVMRTALKNSLFFMLFSVVSQQVIGLFMAVVLTNIRRGRNLFKNTYYLPVVISSAAIGLMFSFFFNPGMGLNSILLDAFGIEGPLWMMDTNGFIILPMWVIAFVACWQYMGTTMMLYMAAISGIPTSLYEASYIDGATKPQSFFRITLPLVKPMMKTTLSLTCIGSLKFFDLIWAMTDEAGPNNKTQVLATHLYTQGFKYFKYGYASAISIVLLLMCLAVTIIINRAIRVDDYEM